MVKPKLRVIIAADADKFKAHLSDSFLKKGWIVKTAKDGKQSTHIVKQFDPDVIIMDIDLPGRDGITACRLIKNDIGLAKNYPVILMGSSANKHKIVKAIEAGCDDFIIKPFDFDVLFNKASAFTEFYQKQKKGLSALEKEQEAEVIIYSKQVIKNVFSNAMYGKLLDYPVVQNVVNKMKEILYTESNLPLAFKMKSYNDYTYIHSVNVASLCLSFAYHLNWEDQDLQILGEGAFLHDVGKTKVDLKILMKPEKLTEAEFSEMKKHPLYAKDVIANSKINDEILKVPLEHHEHIDGKGYPYQLCNEEISKYGKLSAIVDVYDALTTDRCYHKGLESNEAVDIMVKGTGQFDPKLFKTFSQLVKSEKIGK